MPSLMVEADGSSVSKSVLELGQEQKKDDLQTNPSKAGADVGVTEAHSTQKDATAKKNLKGQNGAKHQQTKGHKVGTPHITAPKKSALPSRKDSQQASANMAIHVQSQVAAQRQEANFREHASEAVRSEEQPTSEHEQGHASEISEAVVVEGGRYDQRSNAEASEQTLICSSEVADACVKDYGSSDNLAMAIDPSSPDDKTDQAVPANNSGGVSKASVDASPKPVVEKAAEKKTIPKGLKRAAEKPSRVSSSDVQSIANAPNSVSPSRKTALAEKSPKTSPSTPKKGSSPVKASKLSPESPGSDGSEEKEELRKGGKKVKGRKSRLGQKEGFTNEQQIQSSEDGSCLNGKNSITTSKQQNGQASTLNKGQLLLKMAKLSYASGDNPHKAFDHATRAVRFFESNATSNSSSCLELVMSLHILAAVHCTMGQYEEAISALQRSLNLLTSDSKSSESELEANSSKEPMLALFSGHMQLGDTFVLAGMHSKALDSYHTALKVQMQALGEMDPLVGDTCRYLSEAHLQAMQFQEAEELCKHILNIHSENSSLGSIEEATDRRLMALILSSKGEHEAALEHLIFASTALSSDKKDVELAAVDCCIGDCYVALGRYDEAVFAYQKALNVFKSVKGEAHASVGAMYISLAEVSLKTGKQREAKSYAENALRIYGKHGVRHALDDLAIGLTEVAAVYEAINEQEQALCLLQRALHILEKAPGEHTAAAGVEAQMGVFYFVMGKPSNSFTAFKNAVLKLRAVSGRNTALVGILLNQMGLACVELNELTYASEVFEEAQLTLEEACGSHHPDTLAVRSNLAGVYDAMGRVDDAISILESILEVKEERLGTVHRDVEEERKRLTELLREVGRPRNRKTSTLEQLLTLPLVGSRRSEEKHR